MKEQNKTPEKELKEMGISNLPDTDFKTLVIMMPDELKGRVDELGTSTEVGNTHIEIECILKNSP